MWKTLWALVGLRDPVGVRDFSAQIPSLTVAMFAECFGLRVVDGSSANPSLRCRPGRMHVASGVRGLRR